MNSVDYFLFELDADLALKQNPQACDSMSLYLEVSKPPLAFGSPVGVMGRGAQSFTHFNALERESRS